MVSLASPGWMTHGNSTAASPGGEHRANHPLLNRRAPGRFSCFRCIWMVSLCLLHRALLRGLGWILRHLEEAGAFDELAGTPLGNHPLLCLFSASKGLGFC